MSTETTIWVIGIAIASFILISAASLGFQGVLISRGDTPYPAPASAQIRSRACEAPPRKFTMEQAHRAMQLHIDCLITECPRKRAAYIVLVEEGYVRPDAGRVQA
jgi:hypothetical protein